MSARRSVSYYKRFPSDYLAKTLHLTMEQDGAYTRLLDWCYSNGSAAVPHTQRYAIARAMKASEKHAVDAVLAEFFTRDGAVWLNGRARREIAASTPAIEAARRNGKRGGRPHKKKPNGFSENNPVGSKTETQWVPNSKAAQKEQEQDQYLQQHVRSSPPDCENHGEGDVPATAVGARPADPRGLVEAAQATNPALAAVVALRSRGAQWLRLTPDNPEIITAIREGVALASIEAFADAYPDKPPLYVIRAARRDHASQPETISKPEQNHAARNAGAVAETLASIRRIGAADSAVNAAAKRLTG
jgi:uncharacterized protein YdaU (DUF1376 family)